jgi:NTE family protein
MSLLRALATASACALLLTGAPALVMASDQDQAQPQPQLQPQPQPQPEPPRRLRVALVLSGGGARGFAHIGVLRVLHELRVPVDVVVGTSMGSVVGGAYAAGATLADLERMARETDWSGVVADRPARPELQFRRREEDLLLPSRIEFGVDSSGLSLPPAAAGNAALEQALARLLPEGTRDTPVNQLALPFRSVASDLVTGELVDLVDTPLFLAMRASLAVPGMFAPVRVRARLVVDGGLVRNLPVDLAHRMGVDVVIAVNVGTPLAPEKDLASALGVAQQMINILTEQNVQRSLKELRPQDILIAPKMRELGFMDFGSATEAIEAGAQAARALAGRLAPLSLDRPEYVRFEQRRLGAPALQDLALALAKPQLHSVGRINAEVLAAQTGLAEGQLRTRAQVRRAADQLYGRVDLQRVDTTIEDRDGVRHVEITATEARWAASRARIGLELASDFNDANSFALKLMHVRSSLNDWDGELRSVMRVGDQRDLAVQWFQPLGPGSRWYLAPSVQYGSASTDLFDDGRRLRRTAYTTHSASLVFGRELGAFGDVQLGLTRQRVGARPLIPETLEASTPSAYASTRFLRYRSDTLDTLGFPSSGHLVDARLEHSLGSSPDALAQARSSVLAMSAFRRGAWAGHVYGEYARARRGAAPLDLGGFLRLSGSVPESVQGRSVAFARLVMARRIALLPATLGGDVRIGFSLEAGGGFDQDVALGETLFKQAASGFLSIDTRFGPAYVGAGATRDGDATAYLFLGPIW